MSQPTTKPNLLALRIKELYHSRELIFGIILLGSLFRFLQYLFRHPLWFDELLCAYDIIHTPLHQFLAPDPPFMLPTTFGFLFSERLVYLIFGSGEHSLRFPVLLAGIMSLVLLWRISIRVLSPNAIPIAMCFFAFSKPLILYSSELKNYSLDIFVSLSLLLIALKLPHENLNIKKVLFYSICGGILILSSIPSPFILGGVVVFVLSSILTKKDYSKLKPFGLVCLVWVLFLAVSGFSGLQYKANNPLNYGDLITYWKDAFPPFAFFSIENFQWIFQVLFNLIRGFFYSHHPLMTSFFFALGLIAFFKKQKNLLVLFLFPILLLITASYFELYPFAFTSHQHMNTGKVILFLMPIFIIIGAEGMGLVFLLKKPYGFLLGGFLLGLITIPPIIDNCVIPTIKPNPYANIMPPVNYVKKHWQEGDIIYVPYNTLFAYKYYSKRYGFTHFPIIEGSQGGLIPDQDKVLGRKRVWMIRFFGWLPDEPKELEILTEDQVIDSAETHTVGDVFLLDLNKKIKTPK